MADDAASVTSSGPTLTQAAELEALKGQMHQLALVSTELKDNMGTLMAAFSSVTTPVTRRKMAAALDEQDEDSVKKVHAKLHRAAKMSQESSDDSGASSASSDSDSDDDLYNGKATGYDAKRVHKFHKLSHTAALQQLRVPKSLGANPAASSVMNELLATQQAALVAKMAGIQGLLEKLKDIAGGSGNGELMEAVRGVRMMATQAEKDALIQLNLLHHRGVDAFVPEFASFEEAAGFAQEVQERTTLPMLVGGCADHKVMKVLQDAAKRHASRLARDEPASRRPRGGLVKHQARGNAYWTGACYVCHELGHLASACPKRVQVTAMAASGSAASAAGPKRS